MIKYLINSMFDELKEQKHFKETKSFRSPQVEVETYLEYKRVSMMELFCEYS